MNSANDPESADKTGPDIKYVPASELATWAVNPLTDLFPMMSGDDLERLGDSLVVGQENAVIVCRRVVLDGRNRIAAGVLKGLMLCVEFCDGLTQEEVERLILSLNVERRFI